MHAAQTEASAAPRAAGMISVASSVTFGGPGRTRTFDLAVMTGRAGMDCWEIDLRDVREGHLFPRHLPILN